MTTSDLERLARVNPIPEPYEEDEAAADELLRRVRLEAKPRERGARRLRLPLAAVALALAVVAVIALAPAGETDRVPPVVEHLTGAERAYAAVLPRGDVIHEVVTSEWSVGGRRRGTEHYEGWYRHSTGQAVRVTGGDEGATRVMITRDGTVLVESQDTARLTGKAGLVEMTSPVTAGFRARNRQDFAAAFRAAYDADQLADRGRTTFDNRPAQRFEIVKGLDGIDSLDFYADPGTGRPLGSVERIGDQTNVRRLTTWERLNPTPGVLARLDIR
jgi:hypothetical protein